MTKFREGSVLADLVQVTGDKYPHWRQWRWNGGARKHAPCQWNGDKQLYLKSEVSEDVAVIEPPSSTEDINWICEC